MYTFPDKLRQVYESSPLSFVYYQNIDDQAVPVLASDGFCKNTGMPREHVLEWLKSGLFGRIHPNDVGIVSKVSDEFLRQAGEYDVIFRCRILQPGSNSELMPDYVLIHGNGKWQTMPDGTQLAVITYSNLTQTMEQIREIRDEYGLFQRDRFYIDPLTDLPNINYLHEYGEEKLGMIRGDGRTPMVVYSDVESMQSYNNQYGVAEGDELLRLVADTLKKFFPKALVIRGADDHFVMLTGIDDHQELTGRMELINETIKKNARGNTSGIRSGICPVCEGAGIGLVKALDHARHALKRMDTNLNMCVQFFSQKADDAYWRNRYIIENFDKALKNGWIKLYYQELYRISSQKISAFEGLARWIDPSRGMISPGEFIPVLLKYHQLYKLDLYMFEQVCAEVRIRKENNLPLVPVSVNFSRQDFDHADIVGEMNRIYDQYGLDQYMDKSYLIIEITEQDVAVGAEQFREQLKKIRENGYRLWLDDFGSGYSSINVFSQYDFDLIKFDMDLLRHLDDHGGVNRVILKEMVYMSRKLGIHTLVEGLETREQLDFIRQTSCELAQGFYYHKPESLDEILFRLQCGEPIKPCEAPEERDQMNWRWFEMKDLDRRGQPEEDQSYSYMMQALSKDYMFLYYVNLKNGHYTEYSADQAHEELNVDGEGIDFFYACKVNAQTIIYPEDLDMFLEAFTRENILHTIQEDGAFHLTYRMQIEGCPVYVALKATQAEGNEDHLIIGVNNVNVQMQLQETQRRLQLEQETTSWIAALFGDLICIDVIDPDTDHFQEYSVEKEHNGLGLQREGDNFFIKVSRKMRELVHPDDLPVVETSFSKEQVLAGIRRYGLFELRYRLLLESEQVHTQLKAVMVRKHEKQILIIGLTNINAEVQREREYAMSLSEARNQAHIDALTGVKNRHAYLQDMDELNRRISSGTPVEFAIAVCDVNNLKQVNDVHGHQAGDAYIKKACQIVCDVFMHSPVYRVGGDEFAVLIQGRDYRHLEALVQQFAEVNKEHKAFGEVVVACGVAHYAPGKSAENVFAEADQNMYEEKKRLKTAT